MSFRSDGASWSLGVFVGIPALGLDGAVFADRTSDAYEIHHLARNRASVQPFRVQRGRG